MDSNLDEAVGLLMECERRDQASALYALVAEAVRRDVTMYEAALAVIARRN